MTARPALEAASRPPPLGENAGEKLAAVLNPLLGDTFAFARRLRELHGVCDELGDLATASLLDGWLEAAEGRLWSLRAMLEGGAG
ncbi:ferritin-like domain-containing protein [Phenylobacterium sp.]|uniref:ferritin-like domain-containing protein n=1 Tax=Phenylobacterium sp. TaxID=1871053 RepID=UPI00286B6110|nr:ferritin-like domain-containing protein [Phenylobacterium sp.]